MSFALAAVVGVVVAQSAFAWSGARPALKTLEQGNAFRVAPSAVVDGYTSVERFSAFFDARAFGADRVTALNRMSVCVGEAAAQLAKEQPGVFFESAPKLAESPDRVTLVRHWGTSSVSERGARFGERRRPVLFPFSKDARNAFDFLGLTFSQDFSVDGRLHGHDGTFEVSLNHCCSRTKGPVPSLTAGSDGAFGASDVRLDWLTVGDDEGFTKNLQWSLTRVANGRNDSPRNNNYDPSQPDLSLFDDGNLFDDLFEALGEPPAWFYERDGQVTFADSKVYDTVAETRPRPLRKSEAVEWSTSTDGSYFKIAVGGTVSQIGAELILRYATYRNAVDNHHPIEAELRFSATQSTNAAELRMQRDLLNGYFNLVRNRCNLKVD